MTRRSVAFPEGKMVECSYDLQKEREAAKKSLKRDFGFNRIVGESKVIRKLLDDIKRISSCDVNVLITGESGTGKELFARAVHYISSRTGKPFIPVNCGAIPENLFENELFGHVKGAFTDASFKQTGLVKEAEGGTLFLDEIGTINPYIQIKLLRLLQESEYKPLGHSMHLKADIRVITATNMDLAKLVEKHEFREDLFYRLKVVPFHIPPLRERQDDIPILIKHFVEKYSREYDKPIKEISKEAMKSLLLYPWPGNIRELENKIQQLVVMASSSVIRDRDIQLPSSESKSLEADLELFKVAKQKAIDAFEKLYLTKLLTKYTGDIVSASVKAGKSRTAFWNLLRKHNLSPKQFQPSKQKVKTK
ncbi:MAG: sigma-54 dependent transcriptional regulator [Candidatus Scalindua sp.]|nr:sigma-54 dependent transcriptional regulator [Candidatus Scalindua sp.]